MDESTEAQVDGWELAGFPGRLKVAAYLTADQHAAQYRLIVDALLDAQEHSLTGVGRDELFVAVRDRLLAATDAEAAERLTGPAVFDLDARMKALQQWDVVIKWQDKAKTEADFVRTRDRYQLTSEASDLHRWLRRSIDDDAVATSAAAFAPAVIADRLDETLLGIADGDYLLAARSWAQVRTTLTDMADAAAIWQSRMASALAGAADSAKMSQLRETLIQYVNVWGAGVDSYSARIGDGIDRLRAAGEADWRAIALAGLDADASDDLVETIISGHLGTLQTLHAWFRDDGSGQARNLRRQVRDVVPPLLRGSRALMATGGIVTRRGELLRIASLVEGAADDAEGWRRWCEATGLWRARHLPGQPDEPNTSPAHTSFWEAPPVPIEVTLRERGPKSTRGRPAQVPDRRQARQEARRRADAERAEYAVAEASLLSRSGSYLADWAPMERRTEAGLFWELLSALLRAQPDDGVRIAYSRDGRFRATAHEAPPDQLTAVVETPDGCVACENWQLELVRV